ncbi:MAG: DEAD/DEAH box helicase family protein [Bacteroidales bacterium]|nr:DEAD/DEAH box helicase family protein [Bacteroidales bacterium]
MLTIFDLLYSKTKTWTKEQKEDNQSVIGNLVTFMENKGKLREPQLEAIEVYLWLKFVGQNKKLSEIIKDGLLYEKLDREYYEFAHIFNGNYVTLFLYKFGVDNELGKFVKELMKDPKGKTTDWNTILEELLHNFEYPNFLYSLPMGAGKTYLMACFIYIDLYFAKINKKDKRFAHNFVVFAPHASKTAILPSLQTIKNFDPEWILPKNEAKLLKQIAHIEVLDSLSSKRKDKLQGNNPNLEKVNRLTQTNKFGLVFITNAEKVVLERYDDKDLAFIKTGQTYIDQKLTDEIKKHNELREKLSQIPNLCVILDEVHHVYQGDGQKEKKLREAVNILNQHNHIVNVLGMSGTPFVKTKVKVGNDEIKLNQIQDIVYNYSLATGIGRFLKIPEVVKVEDVKESTFLTQSLDRFFKDFDITYPNGALSKMAFYCPSIKTLNEEILPVIRDWYRENRKGKEDEIFRYYSSVTKENKAYELPKQSLTIFNNLDKPYSKIRIILLVAIGTEGWDCRSLTAVVLPRKTTTKNFVLQTTARCLREVEKAKNEKALIYLGAGNYDTLDKELKENYKLTINDLKLTGENDVPVIVRKPKLGQLEYKQIIYKYHINILKQTQDFKTQLQNFDFDVFKKKFDYTAKETIGKISDSGMQSEMSENIEQYITHQYNFSNFIYDLTKALYYRYTPNEILSEYKNELKKIHAVLNKNYTWIVNNPNIELKHVINYIASHLTYVIEYKTETIEDLNLINLLEWTSPAFINYGGGKMIPRIEKRNVKRIKNKERLMIHWEDHIDDFGDPDPQDLSYNYIPYRFDSDFEIEAINQMLRLGSLSHLEVYFNGTKEQNLHSFTIQTPQGRYTPDFLIIKRKGKRYELQEDNEQDKQVGEIDKMLIIEIKGEPYYTEEFQQKEKFVKDVFLKHNPKFEYVCFIDKGKNDFKQHIKELEKLVKEL